MIFYSSNSTNLKVADILKKHFKEFISLVLAKIASNRSIFMLQTIPGLSYIMFKGCKTGSST